MDLQIVKDATPQVELVNGQADIAYTMVVKNNGPNQAHNVVVADAAPSGVTFLAVTTQPAGGSCSTTAALLSCNLGTLGPGVERTIGLSARVTQTGTYDNCATVTGQGGDRLVADLAVEGVEGPPVHAVFIRAPVVERVDDGVEVLATVSGRPVLVFKVEFPRDKVGEFDTELVREWFNAFAINAGVTLHVETLYGENSHHIAESCFKGLARALRTAVAIDPRAAGEVPSTKGQLGG